MESTDQVIHLPESPSLETGIDQRHDSSSTHISVTEVIHYTSSGSTTHSTGPTTPHAAATTSSGTVLESRRQEAYKINSSNQVNLVRAQATALGHVHVPPLVSSYHVQYRVKVHNRPYVAQRICSLPKCFRMQSKLICRKNETDMKTHKLNRLREARRAAIIAVMSP
ncbi:hypothetical protein B0H65DRAFT_441131 [Neurospora tetraspora]|uniref:Uncharacterized protein n=1 Tax=Neurospora tetraspora TaxID=94610 RepID=A0AAE0MT65_9PEZI|nr:hypothetical protein B0H65DRAFT_441131 [Neurospora tetraspora]